MTSTPPSRPLPPRASGDHEPLLLSPLMGIMPTGYRNIQPFQKGKGWHSNGRTPRRRAASTQASEDVDTDQHLSPEKERGVVFPPLAGHDTERPGSQGPDVSAVEGAANSEQRDDRQEQDEAVSGSLLISPRAPSTPPTGGPRRPPRTDPRGNSNSGGSFRSRALSSNGVSSRPTSPATITDNDENLKSPENEKAKAVAGPDPAIMQQLWQEYSARSHAATRTVDAAAYHERMHRRYGEQRALKERVAQLEQALEQMELERNQAQARADAKQLELLARDRSASELPRTIATSDAARLSLATSTQGEPVNAEERSYRERSFVLERALSQSKASILALQEQLSQKTTQATERTQALEAQLVLERNSSLELARQLREASAGFTRASSELVETRVMLEREQQRIQEVNENARLHSAQLVSDTRRAQLESRMKLAVRSLGREAMRHKVETFMNRALRAEQQMRVAQLETERIRRERDATCDQLEKVLSSHAIKYHSLGATGGVPGILKRGTTLSHSSRMVSGQLLFLQVLYEEPEEPEDPDDAFCVHFVAYEPRSAQDDYLTFHLRDVQRLVPNHDSYLAQHSVRRRERLEALAELLLGHIHAGYKNGHLVLAETSGPEAASQLPRELLAAQQEQQHKQEVMVYRGTRYIQVVDMDDTEDTALAELSVVEAFAAATSQIWWLEINAVLLGYEGTVDIDSLAIKVDLRHLLTFCATFGSYRPSQSIDGVNNDVAELFAVHEALLEPLFHNLRVKISDADGISRLEIAGFKDDSVQPSTVADLQSRKRRLSVELRENVLEQSEKESTTAPLSVVPSTLTYQCVVNVDETFYCVRFQELWDGELQLDITMDDPETQHHFHRVLSESQLTKLVARLVRDGALEGEDFGDDTTQEERESAALQVKYGIATTLHRPLCQLVRDNIRPILPHPSQDKSNAALDGDIDVGSLFEDEEGDGKSASDEKRVMVLDSPLFEANGSLYRRELCVIGACQDVLSDEHGVHQVLQQLLTAERDHSLAELKRQRTGFRLQGSSSFVLVQMISTTLPRCGSVALVDVLLMPPGPTAPERLPLVLMINSSPTDQMILQQALVAIGLLP